MCTLEHVMHSPTGHVICNPDRVLDAQPFLLCCSHRLTLSQRVCSIFAVCAADNSPFQGQDRF